MYENIHTFISKRKKTTTTKNMHAHIMLKGWSRGKVGAKNKLRTETQMPQCLP
jgi:hypothetical protein